MNLRLPIGIEPLGKPNQLFDCHVTVELLVLADVGDIPAHFTVCSFVGSYMAKNRRVAAGGMCHAQQHLDCCALSSPVPAKKTGGAIGGDTEIKGANSGELSELLG